MNEKVIKIISEIVAEKLNDHLTFSDVDIVQESISEAIVETLGDIVDENSTEYMELVMELCGRVRITVE